MAMSTKLFLSTALKLGRNSSPIISTAVVHCNNTCFLQTANITSAGGKATRKQYKPYDYRRKRFTHLQQPFDRTARRLDDNSKVIVIDGPIASGKTEFAQKLAHELNFKFVPQPNPKDLYKFGSEGLTFLDLDDLLESRNQVYTLEKFYGDKCPNAADGGRAGQLQLDFFTSRLFAYNDALLHLLSTGQGVVCVRSPWTDRVFAKALYENGYMSRAGFQYYTEEIARHHLVDFPRPHLVVYLDADVEETKNNIKRRNVESEVNTNILTDSYLLSIENEYKDAVLPALEEHGELLVYPSIPNITEHEISLMAEDIEALGPMRHSGFVDDQHLADWSNMRDEELAYKRREYQDLRLAYKIYSHERPWNAPEMLRDDYFHEARSKLYNNEAGWRFETAYDPAISPWWKIALGIRAVPGNKDRRQFWIPA